MKITSVNVGIKKYQPTFKKRGIDCSQKTQVPQVLQNEAKPQSKFKKALPYVLAATVGVVGLGAGLLIGSKKPAKMADLRIDYYGTQLDCHIATATINAINYIDWYHLS